MTAPVPRPGIMDIAPYVGGDSKIAGVDKVIKLASNEGALGPSPKAMKAFADLAGKLERYPEGGSEVLRAAIGKRHGLDPARIVCSSGSDELIALLTRSYVGVGDEVVYSQHGFLMYPLATLACGGVPVVAPEKDLRADVDALLAAVTPKTKILFLANPNNPTGTYLPPEEVRRLHAGLPASVLLVIDAAYAEYVVRNDYTAGADEVTASDNVVMLRTFSKIYALAALRLGWAYCPPAIADVLNRVRGPFNVSAAAQAAGVAALEDQAFVDASRAHNDVWRPWLTEQLTKMGLEVVPSVGNFLLVKFPKEAGRDANAGHAAMLSRGIITRKVAAYGLGDYIRITIGTEEEMRAVAAALAAFMTGK